MKFRLCIAILLTSLSAFAQKPPVAKKAWYQKLQVSAGYSYQSVGGFLGSGDLYGEGTELKLENEGTYASPDLSANPENLWPSSPRRYEGKRKRAGMHGFKVGITHPYKNDLSFRLEVATHSGSTTANFPGIWASAPMVYNPGIMISPLMSSYPGSFPHRGLILFPSATYTAKQRSLSILGGVEWEQETAGKKFTPFAHALIGFANQKLKLGGFTRRDSAFFGEKTTFSNWGFAASLGGGLSVHLNKRLKLHLPVIAYHPVRISEQTVIAYKQPVVNTGVKNNLTFTNIETAAIYSNNEYKFKGRWQHNFTLGVSVVVKFP